MRERDLLNESTQKSNLKNSSACLITCTLALITPKQVKWFVFSQSSWVLEQDLYCSLTGNSKWVSSSVMHRGSALETKLVMTNNVPFVSLQTENKNCFLFRKVNRLDSWTLNTARGAELSSQDAYLPGYSLNMAFLFQFNTEKSLLLNKKTLSNKGLSYSRVLELHRLC